MMQLHTSVTEWIFRLWIMRHCGRAARENMTYAILEGFLIFPAGRLYWRRIGIRKTVVRFLPIR